MFILALALFIATAVAALLHRTDWWFWVPALLLLLTLMSGAERDWKRFRGKS